MSFKLPRDRTFGQFFGILFAFVGGYCLLNTFIYLGVIFAVLSLILLLLAFLRPHMLRPLNLAWTRLGLILSKLFTPLFLGLIYFCIVTPYGIIRKIIGNDPLLLKDRGAASYWLNVEDKNMKPDSFKKQY